MTKVAVTSSILPARWKLIMQSRGQCCITCVVPRYRPYHPHVGIHINTFINAHKMAHELVYLHVYFLLWAFNYQTVV